MPAIDLTDARERSFSGILAPAMPRLQDTAYPRLKTVLTARDLAVAFTPTDDELVLARRTAHGPAAQLGFLVLLKLFQRLGRPVPLADTPRPVVDHIARAVAIPRPCSERVWDQSDPSHRKCTHAGCPRAGR
jgi:Domain of unknown function (DUF4158)